jgi:hypothetical protein
VRAETDGWYTLCNFEDEPELLRLLRLRRPKLTAKQARALTSEAVREALAADFTQAFSVTSWSQALRTFLLEQSNAISMQRLRALKHRLDGCFDDGDTRQPEETFLAVRPP